MNWRGLERFSLGSAFGGATDQIAPAISPRIGVTTSPVDLRVLELLTARLCHDLIGPVAAINNGVELLADNAGLVRGGPDPDLLRDALALVGDSASQAASRLQFYRFAYGYGHGGVIAGAPPSELASRFFEHTRIACDYGESIPALPLDWQRLGCNFLLTGAEVLSRGGNLALAVIPGGLDLEVTGEFAGLSPETTAALLLETPVAALTPRSVQAYFTGLVAQTLGCRLVRTEGTRRLRLTAIALAA
jgi:histidine phosphotransferase ChpT